MSPVDPDHLHKHLEFIQNIIARLANNGFLVKGWSLTVSGAFFGFGIQQSHAGIAVTGILPALTFWWLDAYFLRSEKMFRELFCSVAANPEQHASFDLDHRPYGDEVGPAWKVMFSETLRVFHPTLVLVGVAVTLILCGATRSG